MSVVIIWKGKESASAEDRSRITRVIRAVYAPGIGRTELDVLSDGRLSLRVATRIDGPAGSGGTDMREAVAMALREAGFAVVAVN
jgi:hypothetical protein